MTDDRTLVLRSLIAFEQPLGAILRRLADFGWDSERPLAELQAADVVRVLQVFMNGNVTASDIESWANALEGREDIVLEGGNADTLSAALFHFANPTLTEPLTIDDAKRWVEKLSEHHQPN